MARAKLREIAEAATINPKQALLDSIGDRIEGWEIGPCRVLVATYIRPEKTIGGVYLADRTLAEDRFQGKVGLVVKIGPLSFEDSGNTFFGGFTPLIGDWVVYNPSHGRELFTVDEKDGGTSLRLFSDQSIDMIIPDPSMVW